MSSIDNGGDSQSGVFWYSVGTKSYKASRILRARPQNQTLIVTLTEAGGGTRNANVEPELEQQANGSFVMTLVLNVLFHESDNPMSRTGMVTVTVSDGDTKIMSVSSRAQGFAEAQRFVQEQQVRLDVMSKRKQCAGCFLTTACCQMIELPDDCFELRTLRAFRDGPLQRMPGGAEDIARYYAHAPAILAEMRRRDEQYRLLRYYLSYILPCAVCARLGLNRLTRLLYRDLMRRLERRYLRVN